MIDKEYTSILLCHLSQETLDWALLRVGSEDSSSDSPDLSHDSNSFGSIPHSLFNDSTLTDDIKVEGEEADTNIGTRTSLDNEISLLEYQAGICFLDDSFALSFEFTLPFSDSKKAYQILPLQIQDLLPFSAKNLHLSVHSCGKNKNGETRYLCSAIENSTFEKIISLFESKGIRVESIYPSSYITAFLPPPITVTREIPSDQAEIVLLRTKTHIYNSIYVTGNPVHFRKILIPDDDNRARELLDSQLNISLTSCLKEFDINRENIGIYRLSSIAPENILSQGSFASVSKVHPAQKYFKTNDHEQNLALIISSACKYFWQSISDASEAPKQNQLPNLRINRFKYVAPFSNIYSSIASEKYFIITFLFFLCTYFYYDFQVFSAQRETLQNQISSITNGVMENPPTVKGSEIPALEQANSEIISELGNLSKVNTLSAIEWLALISETIPSSIHFETSAISFDNEGLTIKGVVDDIPTTGRIDALLKRMQSDNPERFCNATIKTEQSRGTTGSRAVTISIELCKA